MITSAIAAAVVAVVSGLMITNHINQSPANSAKKCSFDGPENLTTEKARTIWPEYVEIRRTYLTRTSEISGIAPDQAAAIADAQAQNDRGWVERPEVLSLIGAVPSGGAAGYRSFYCSVIVESHRATLTLSGDVRDADLVNRLAALEMEFNATHPYFVFFNTGLSTCLLQKIINGFQEDNQSSPGPNWTPKEAEIFSRTVELLCPQLKK